VLYLCYRVCYENQRPLKALILFEYTVVILPVGV